jgi:cyclic pyranopterin phosphate synthase
MYLIDPLNRKIDYLRISVTDRCNLRCIYCIPQKAPRCAKKTELMTSREILSFVKVAGKHGLRKVRLTGGEPLLRPDLIKLISGIKGLGIEDLSLTTNGILLADKLPALMEAGLDRVNLSLDTMKPERFSLLTRGGSLDAVLRAMELLEESSPGPVKINMVPIRGINEDEIVSFARLTLTRPLHLRFIELMPIGDGAWSRARLIKAEEAMNTVTSTLGPLEQMGRTGSSRNYALKGAKGILGFISPQSNHFCSTCDRLRVTAKGKLRPCLFSFFEIDLKKARSEDEMEEMLLLAVRNKPARKPEFGSLPCGAMSHIGG